MQRGGPVSPGKAGVPSRLVRNPLGGNTVNGHAPRQVPDRTGWPGVRPPENASRGRRHGPQAAQECAWADGRITRPATPRPPQVSCFGAQRGPRGPIPARLWGNEARRRERRPGPHTPTGTPSRGQIHAQPVVRQRASATRRAGQALESAAVTGLCCWTIVFGMPGRSLGRRREARAAVTGVKSRPTRPAPPNQTLDRTPGHGP